MGDDHREQGQLHVEDLGEGRVRGDTGDDAGQGDRDQDQEGDRLPAEELWRATASEASVPRTNATGGSGADLTGVPGASRAAWSRIALGTSSG